MAQQSSLHPYLDWTKQRIDEMDGTLASLEAQAGRVGAESKAKAEQLLADLKRRREGFAAEAKAHAAAGEAALKNAKTQLEWQWSAFEAQLKAYFETAGKQLEQQQATFRTAAIAQAKAWHDAADRLHAEAVKAAESRRADIDAAVKQMKADAAEAEARLQKLRQAGNESWTTLSAALTESRKAFDQAIHKAWDVFKAATPPKP